MICISSPNWANIAEGVPTLKRHLSWEACQLAALIICLSSLMCGEQHTLITVIGQ